MHNKQNIKLFFDNLYTEYNHKGHIFSDPISFPHEIKDSLSGDFALSSDNTISKNIRILEFVSLTSALFAYGKVSLFKRFLENFFKEFGTDPLELNDEAIKNTELYYRFQKPSDVRLYAQIMKEFYVQHGGLCTLAKHLNDATKAYSFLRNFFFTYLDARTKGLYMLLPDLDKGAAKRVMMFFRWMIRKDEVDFGLWSFLDVNSIVMPVDTHIMRLMMHLGVVSGSNGTKAKNSITAYFREMSPTDPLRYDFALTRLGIERGCQYSKSEACNGCKHNNGTCVFVELSD